MLTSRLYVTFSAVALHGIILFPAMLLSLSLPIINYSEAGEHKRLNRACGIRPIGFEESPHRRLHRRTKRVIGGEGAEMGEFPWQAALGAHDASGTFNQFCGGALVHAQWILTAAHCLVLFDAGHKGKAITVRLGMTDDHNLTNHIDAQLSQRIVHEEYEYYRWGQNDIALLKLVEPVPLSQCIFPVCMAPYKSYAGTVGILTGWGQLFEGGPRTHVLQKTRVPFIDNKECQQWYTRFSGVRITPEVICTVDRRGARGACGGDSGSPIVQEMDGRWVLVGIVSGSYRRSCSWPDYSGPTSFGFVPRFADWIQEKTNGDVHLTK